MSSKMSTRPRKHKHKDDMKQETVVQVHKTIKSDASSDDKTKRTEDKNDNYTTTPSREISVDEESQINSKIISLIESEMKRDANKQSHFTDSRPQSLSFYEDEKMPEELSGNLELLSPEERKHYKKRKEYLQMDTDEMNVYNVIQDLYGSRDGDEIISSAKKSKSRKKRHAESELGIGDSREMMIPKEKKKSKKKKRDSSPVSSTKRKHKKNEFEAKTDITVALEDLQDDVFENNEDFSAVKPEKIRKSPRKSDKVYVQKKNKFEAISRPNNLNRQAAYDAEDDFSAKRFPTYPLELAIPFQEYWMRFSMFCHGLLGGLAFCHWLYVISNINVQDEEFITHYSHFSETYVSIFYFLSVICLISVFEKVDFAHFEGAQFKNIFRFKRSSIIILLYFVSLIVHLSAARIDYKLGLVSYYNDTISNITGTELSEWNHLSLWRSTLAFLAWIIVGLYPQENMFYLHLKSMEKYLPHK